MQWRIWAGVGTTIFVLLFFVLLYNKNMLGNSGQSKKEEADMGIVSQATGEVFSNQEAVPPTDFFDFCQSSGMGQLLQEYYRVDFSLSRGIMNRNFASDRACTYTGILLNGETVFLEVALANDPGKTIFLQEKNNSSSSVQENIDVSAKFISFQAEAFFQKVSGTTSLTKQNSWNVWIHRARLTYLIGPLVQTDHDDEATQEILTKIAQRLLVF